MSGLGSGGLPKLRQAGANQNAGTSSARAAPPKAPLTKAPTAAPMRQTSSSPVNVVSAGLRDLRAGGGIATAKFSTTGNSQFTGSLAGKSLSSPSHSTGSAEENVRRGVGGGATSARSGPVAHPPPMSASPASARAAMQTKVMKHGAAGSASAPVTPAAGNPSLKAPQRRPPGPIKAPTAADMGMTAGSSNQKFVSMVGTQANVINQPTEADQLEVQRLVEQAKWKQMQRSVYAPGGPSSGPQTITLNLSSRGLKQVGPDVVAIDRLSNLNLNNNNIELVPATMSSLSNLVTLSICNNMLLNLPPELSQLKSLQELALSGNRIKTVPQFMGNLPQLQKLYLGSNRISDLPSTMEKLSELRVLSLYDNEFAKAPAVVQNMQVRELHLSYNKLSVIPEEYCHIASLVELHVDCNKLTTLPRSIGLLSSLKVLSVNGNSLQSLPRGITSMGSLSTLLICSNKVDILPLGFNQMPMKEFDFAYNPLSLDDIAGTFLNSLMSNGVRGPEQKPLLRSHSPLVNLNGRCPVGSALIQGKRDYMEDRVVIENDFKGIDGDFVVAVFDGHGGEDCAEHCRDVFIPSFQSALKHSVGVMTALSDTFKGMHQQVIDKKITSGSTATVGVVINKTLYLANAGDSRAILCRKDGPIRLSVEHKGTNEQEADRVVKLGGFIAEGRVNRILAVTRSIGDVDLNPFVIPDPDIKVHDITPEDEYLCVASDGVWDVMTDEDVSKVVMACPNVQVAAMKIRDYSYMSGSMDNISVIIVKLQTKGSLSKK